MKNRCQEGVENDAPQDFVKTCCNRYQTWKPNRKRRCEIAKANMSVNTLSNVFEKAQNVANQNVGTFRNAPKADKETIEQIRENLLAQNEGKGIVDFEERDNKPLQQLLSQGQKDSNNIMDEFDAIDPDIDYTGTTVAPLRNIKDVQSDAAQSLNQRSAEILGRFAKRGKKLNEAANTSESIRTDASEFNKSARALKEKMQKQKKWPFSK